MYKPTVSHMLQQMRTHQSGQKSSYSLLLPAVSMLRLIRVSPFPFTFCFCQVIQSPFKPSRLCLSAVVFVREIRVCQRPPLASWTQLNRRCKKSWKFTHHCRWISSLVVTTRAAREDTYWGESAWSQFWGESAWNQFKRLDWFQGAAEGGKKTHWFRFSEISFEPSRKV